MGWFDEQIKQRKNKDREDFEDSFLDLAEAVVGRGSITKERDSLEMANDAISQILRYFHIKARELPEGLSDMEHVLDYQLRPHGIMSRTITLGEKWRKKENVVMLSKIGDTVVALIPAIPSGYKYYDTVTGKYVRVNRFNEKKIDSEAVAFYKPFPVGPVTLKSLIRYILENIRIIDLLMYFLFLSMETSLGVLLVDVVEALFSEELLTVDWSEVAVIALGVFTVVAIIFKTTWGLIYNWIEGRIETQMRFNVSSAAMMRMLSLPPSFFKQYSAGELSDRVQQVDDLVSNIVDVALSLFSTSVFSLMYISQIAENAGPLLVPALCTTTLTVVVSVATIIFNMRRSREIMFTEAKESGMTYALISGIRKIRLAGAEHRAFARWAKLYKTEAQKRYNPPLFVKLNATIILAISLVGTLVMYFLAIKNGISVGQYFAFNAAYAILTSTFSSAALMATMIASIKPTLDITQPILNAAPEISEDRELVRSISGAVELNNVTFAYGPDLPPVLNDLSLKIRPGEYVAIVGETGCGKSTLMRLMLGFEKPQHGSVYYDGKDLQSLDARSVRQKIGTVMQDGKLFAGNIYSNIVISAPQLTEEDAWEAAEMAGMAEDIRRMPMGMQTIISEGQGGFSGGQKQRIMIARAIAPKPKILMFDEATSALDNITQKIVSDSLDSLKCTRIVIAHRLSTIKNCNRIVVMEKGHIVENGTYEELMEKNGLFAELVRRQMVEQTA